ncbi:MAG: hypothetical protein GC201_12815 [Alphaproteobacteria bacterium]|nr:hypothetical protein [Alphaproteobacteria bacterium]
MPRYFFDIDDGESSTEDDEGLMLDDREQARLYAIGALPTIAEEVLPDGERRTFVIVVRDETRRAIFRASLSFLSEWIVPVTDDR